MSDLAEFLLARIAEDEAAAEAGASAPSYEHYGDTAAEETLEMALNEGCNPAGAGHFRRWLPARVLAECEAKRRIVENAAGPGEGDYYRGMDQMHEEVLRLLALPYADHEAYREEWRP